MACFTCQNKTLYTVLDLGYLHIPRFNTEPYNFGPKFPLKLVFCKKCKLVQLETVTPRAILYDDNYGYRSTVNSTMRTELKNIVKNVYKYVDLEENDIVIDIGANDGYLLSQYPDKVYKVGVEPVKKFAKEVAKNKKIKGNWKYIDDYFSYQPTISKFFSPAKAITAISMFYDLETPNEFVKDLKKSLHPQGIIIIQQNYLVEMLNQSAFDNIIHEHLQYYSLTALNNLFKKHNLEIFHVEDSTLNGGSIRTYIAHPGIFAKTRSFELQLESEKKINWEKALKKFGQTTKNNIHKLRDFILKEKKKGKVFHLYGASNRGNTIVQTANIQKYMTKVAERNPEKYGKYFLGVPITSEEESRKEADYFIVLPWFFQDEIIEREKDFKGGLIFPLPELEVIK